MTEKKNNNKLIQQFTPKNQHEKIENVSIIIPALNEEQYIRACIESIKRSDYPKDKLEIIVVDNGSTDRTIEIVKAVGIRFLIDKNKMVGGLRNLGCEIAKGSIYGFLDADCTVSPSWLRKACKVLKEPTIGITGSRLRAPEDGNWIQKSWVTHLLSRNMKGGDVTYINSGNCFMRKRVFDAVGGFSETLKTSEDVDICERVKQIGYKAYNCDEIRAIHWGYPKTLREFIKREIWHGVGDTKKKLFSFWKSKTLLIALYNTLVLIIVLPVSLITSNAIALPPCLFFFPPLLFATATSIKVNKPKYFINLIVLYTLYGMARTISFILVTKEYLQRRA